jgi:excisionase family DNA binding protein
MSTGSTGLAKWEKKRGKPPKPATITVEEAARRLRIGRNQAYAACKAGQIPAFRVGTRWLVPLPAFERLLLEGSIQPTV